MQIPNKILKIWPEVSFYPDKIFKFLLQVCARIRIKFCRDRGLCRDPDKKKFGMFHIWQILAAISVTGWSNIVVAEGGGYSLMAQKINQLKCFEFKSVFATFLRVQPPGP